MDLNIQGPTAFPLLPTADWIAAHYQILVLDTQFGIKGKPLFHNQDIVDHEHMRNSASFQSAPAGCWPVNDAATP